MPSWAAAATMLASANGRPLLQQKPAHRLPYAEARRHTVIDRAVQQTAGLVGHAEAAGAECLIDVFGRGAGERHFEIVNDRGAVCRDRRYESASHQVDDDRPEPGLDDVRAQSPDDAAPARGPDHRVDDGAKVRRRQHIRQRIDKRRQAHSRLPGTSEVFNPRLAVARGQRIGAYAGQIELFVVEALNAHTLRLCITKKGDHEGTGLGLGAGG